MKETAATVMAESNVSNFQIQYFPDEAKRNIDEICKKLKCSRKEVFIAISNNWEKVYEFLVKEKIILPKN